MGCSQPRLSLQGEVRFGILRKLAEIFRERRQKVTAWHKQQRTARGARLLQRRGDGLGPKIFLDELTHT